MKEIIETGEAEIGYLRTDKMVADGLTKALDKTKQELFVAMLGMYETRFLIFFSFVKKFFVF